MSECLTASGKGLTSCPCCGDVMNGDGQGGVLESLSFQERLRTANDRVWL